MTSRYTSDPAQIAADLRRRADQPDPPPRPRPKPAAALRPAPHQRAHPAGAARPGGQVALHTRVARRGGDAPPRRAAVDALVRQLHLAESGGETSAAQYGSPLFGPRVG